MLKTINLLPASFVRFVPAAVLLLFLCSCSLRSLMVAETVNIISDGISAFEQDDDIQMLEKAFPANIKLLETFLAADPDNYNALVLLSRFYALYGFVYFEGRLENAHLKKQGPGPIDTGVRENHPAKLRQDAVRCYQKGAAYALRAIDGRHRGSREKLRHISTRDDFFIALGETDAPALFWYGFNLGGYVNLNRNSVRAIARAHLAEKAMKRVIELKPDYYHAGAHVFLLSYYASRPPMLGGNLEASLYHYRQVKKRMGDGYLLPDFYFARYYLHQKQNRQEYERLLKNIMSYPETESEFRLHNTTAASRAKVYLEAIDRLFVGKNNESEKP
ncbi:TRAP transporter TatT component family protein [Thermodesulfobacteriota bacterium]